MSLITKSYMSLFIALASVWALRGYTPVQEAVSFKMILSKSAMGINERIRVDFVMNKDGDNFNPPSFQGFRVVMGPSQATSFSWVNGVKSFSKTFSYTIAPLEKGAFTIGQATIDIDGNSYKTIPEKVTVTDAVKKPSEDMTAEDVANESLHLVAEVSNQNPYLNEMVTVVYKLYVGPDISVTNFRALDNPTYNNFWNQDIAVTKYTFESGSYEGIASQYVVLKRVVLYPQKSGELSIEPLVLDVTAEVPTNRRDFFGGRLFAQTNKTVTAGKRTIQVKALPESGKPESFSGAVGSFDLFVTSSKDILNANESLQAIVTVKGSGNLKLFTLPELKLPAALEVYDPEFNEAVTTNQSGMKGKISNNYTIIPAFKGKYPIPEISFSYFDPNLEKYISLQSEPIIINVIEGPLQTNEKAKEENSEKASVNKQALTVSQQAFGFIKTNTSLVKKTQKPFFSSLLFYVLWLLPLLLIPLVVFLIKKQREKQGDLVGLLSKRAQRLAAKFLSEAKQARGNKEDFYVALEKGLQLYLKGKLQIETADFNKENITLVFEARKVKQDSIQSFILLLEHCEAARYSPFTAVEITADYQEAIKTISELDSQL
ncbi:MAG: BatD family protein [Flavobacteriaceae bacterium]|tara:strand:- start:3690 stop:5492 length:1803 start_codon:yes stop_codon:yes gene_type:complete